EILAEFALLKHAGLVPDEAALSTVSLFNQFTSRRKDINKCLLVYLDDGFAEVIYVDRGLLEFSRAISFKNDGLESLAKEIKLTVTVLEAEGKSIEKVVVSGKFAAVPEVVGLLKKSLEAAIETDDSLDTLKGFVQENALLKISLLPEEYKIRKVKETRARSLIYLGILFLLNLSLIANIAFFKIKAKDGYLYALKAEIKKIEARAQGLQKDMVRTRTLREYIGSGRMKLGLLSEIYRAAPEGVTLNSLDISGNKGQGAIVVIGQAQDSESVIKFTNSLKSSPFILKTDVNYINKRRLPGQSAADFEIRANF
ncbi:MAG: PilN domain-containing protein, partial [Candidatus Omnitrophica bacterium]|nr:PilN domain-containing protein [Candidatus Omnitrophota bacterium]